MEIEVKVTATTEVEWTSRGDRPVEGFETPRPSENLAAIARARRRANGSLVRPGARRTGLRGFTGVAIGDKIFRGMPSGRPARRDSPPPSC